MMKKVLYDIFAITAFTMTPVSAGSSSATSVSIVSSVVAMVPISGVPSGIGTFNHNHTQVCSSCLSGERREATCTYPDLPAIIGVFGRH